MYEYMIMIISDNRGNKYSYDFTADNSGSLTGEAIAIGTGSSYTVAAKRARAAAEQRVAERGADYMTRWTESKRNASAYDDSWHGIGEYCK